MTPVVLFDWSSPRAQRARWMYMLRAFSWYAVLAAAILLVSGGFLLYLGSSLAWAALGLLAPLYMIWLWYARGLSVLPVDAASPTIHGQLSVELLGILPKDVTTKILAEAIAHTRGGHFMRTRLGLSATAVRDMVSDSPEDIAAVYARALEYCQTQKTSLDETVLLLSLIECVPPQLRQALFGQLGIGEDDIREVSSWYGELVAATGERAPSNGGIGRDWAFGWAPALSRLAQNISMYPNNKPDIRTSETGDALDLLSSDRPAVALVGLPGVGKTEFIHELARQMMYPDEQVPKALWYHQVYVVRASSLVSAAQKVPIGELLRALFTEAAKAKNVVICFDDAEAFLDDTPQSLHAMAEVIPLLESIRVPVIFACDEQRYLRIAQVAPTFATLTQRLTLQPASEPQTLTALRHHVPQLESGKVFFMHQALRRAYALGKRYVYDVAMPGQALSLLESAVAHAEEGVVTARSVDLAAQQLTGATVALASTDDDKELLLHLEETIGQRVVGQESAVRAVSEALRRARAGVRNESRPIGTFLFLGPTGVGKTELAKALAEVYFKGQDNLIRLDMNEFALAEDVTRLIADPASNPSSLTAQVMKHPFSVILLDEIEKAHSSVLTTLLQLLDEGVLRDENNREVSFKDTVVIATSNANADRIYEYLSRGYQLAQFQQAFIDELIGGHVFHPEFLNRFDEMVVFGPLSEANLLQVVDKIIAEVNRHIEAQGVQVSVDESAKRYLVSAGYDVRLGARPMRRVVQRAVENILATKLLEGSTVSGDTVVLGVDEVSRELARGKDTPAHIAP